MTDSYIAIQKPFSICIVFISFNLDMDQPVLQLLYDARGHKRPQKIIPFDELGRNEGREYEWNGTSFVVDKSVVEQLHQDHGLLNFRDHYAVHPATSVQHLQLIRIQEDNQLISPVYFALGAIRADVQHVLWHEDSKVFPHLKTLPPDTQGVLGPGKDLFLTLKEMPLGFMILHEAQSTMLSDSLLSP